MSQYIGHSGLSFARIWHHVDLANDHRSLGRLASSIAVKLMGKHKPVFHPTQDCGDYVVVTNCRKIAVTGKKMEQRTYWSHTGRPGSLKLTPMKVVVQNKGYGELLRKAVSGMLPKNKLRQARLDRLKVFEDDIHPYEQNFTAFAYQQPKILKRIEKLEEQANINK